nr:Mitochondrial Rho GTPase 1 [Rachicladosporium sp. CCFEE 5018]
MLQSIMSTVRICIVGDEGVGKSSILTSLVKDTFITSPLQPTLPPITLPPTLGTPENVTTTIVDTSSLPQSRDALRKEVRKCNVILLVYSDHYSYERVALYWMPYFRSLGVNVPVVLCASKSDLASANSSTAQIVEEEMLPVMAEFKEIDSCIRVSAREHFNINECFWLAQKAVTHPIAPIYDAKENALKPAAVEALKRVFYLSDQDQDGVLNDAELHDFQRKCFEKDISADDLTNIKRTIQRWSSVSGELEHGVDLDSFLLLHKIFAEKGRHETIWIILRKFNYADSLSLKDTFLHPKFDIPPFASAELSPAGYRFFVDLFITHDADNDGGLSDTELATLFAPTPGVPTSWTDSNFPHCTVTNTSGFVTLQGWLAQWSMTTFEDPKITLEYLAYLGFEALPGKTSASALKLTKPRRRRSGKSPSRTETVDRTVLFCYLLGAPGSGKSTLLNAFLNRPFSPTYNPTIKPRTAVNSVELPGGKQIHLILSELGELEPAVLENPQKLESCDLIAYCYDSSDPDSFAHVSSLRSKYSVLTSVPSIFIATKADQDRVVQRAEVQPDAYCEALAMSKPLHVSAQWKSIGEVFVQVAEFSTMPGMGMPKVQDEDDGLQWVGLMAGVGVAVVGVAAGVVMWKKFGGPGSGSGT